MTRYGGGGTGLKLNDQDSDSVLFRPMPTWVVRRNKRQLPEYRNDGEEIAKNFRLNNPENQDLENTRFPESVKVWKEGFDAGIDAI